MTAQAKIEALEAKLREISEPVPGDVRRVNAIRRTLQGNIDALRFLDSIGLTSKGGLTLSFAIFTQSGAQQ
jgi:hypothetical protein